MKILSRNNHYVPQFYLNNWGFEHKILAMQLLVNNENIPVWRYETIKKTAVHRNLYIQTTKQKETDKIETWFNEEYETPVQGAFSKAINDERLTPEDWKRLVNFLASMSMRTPARIVNNFEKIKKILPEILEKLQNDFEKMPYDEIKSKITSSRYDVNQDELVAPIRVHIEDNQDDIETVFAKIEVSVGKGLILWSMIRTLTTTAEILHNHHWSIVSVAEGMSWATTDDPVLCINYYGKDNYDFGGGWNNKGSEIIFPISPTRALYTQVGSKHPRRFSFDLEKSQDIQKMIIGHAHRKIYSYLPDPDIEKLRPRKVDLEMYNDEVKQWTKFHQDQIELEKEYYNGENS